MNLEKFTATVNTIKENQKKHSGYIALSDLKTLDKMLADAKKLSKENGKLSALYDDAVNTRIGYQKQIKPTEKRFNDANKNVEKVKSDNVKRLKAAEKEANTAQNKYYQLENLYNNSLEVEGVRERQIEAAAGNAIAFEERFKNAIKSFQNAAKALGVKVDTKKYTTAANSVNIL